MVTRQGLVCILAVPLTDQQRAQASLPVTMSRLSLRLAEDHATAAYSTSFLAAKDLVNNLLRKQVSEASSPVSSQVRSLPVGWAFSPRLQ